MVVQCSAVKRTAFVGECDCSPRATLTTELKHTPCRYQFCKTIAEVDEDFNITHPSSIHDKQEQQARQISPAGPAAKRQCPAREGAGVHGNAGANGAIGQAGG
jgi:hypothetical protein